MDDEYKGIFDLKMTCDCGKAIKTRVCFRQPFLVKCKNCHKKLIESDGSRIQHNVEFIMNVAWN
jgi:ribosomal protein S27E